MNQSDTRSISSISSVNSFITEKKKVKDGVLLLHGIKERGIPVLCVFFLFHFLLCIHILLYPPQDNNNTIQLVFGPSPLVYPSIHSLLNTHTVPLLPSLSLPPFILFVQLFFNSPLLPLLFLHLLTLPLTILLSSTPTLPPSITAGCTYQFIHTPFLAFLSSQQPFLFFIGESHCSIHSLTHFLSSLPRLRQQTQLCLLPYSLSFYFFYLLRFLFLSYLSLLLLSPLTLSTYSDYSPSPLNDTHTPIQPTKLPRTKATNNKDNITILFHW